MYHGQRGFSYADCYMPTRVKVEGNLATNHLVKNANNKFAILVEGKVE